MSDQDAAGPPASILTPENHGPIVLIFAIFLTSLSGVFGIARLWVQVKQKVPFLLDDFLYYVSLAFLLASTGTLLGAEHYGLGRYASAVSPHDLNAYYKLIYSFHILGLGFSNVASKGSIIALHRRIQFSKASRATYLILVALVVVYGLFSVFAFAFQCNVPRPWRFEPANCPTKGNLFYVVVALNILTDLAITASVVPDIWRLNTSRGQRVTLAMLFGHRAFLVGVPSIFLITYYALAMDGTYDATRSFVVPLILENVVCNVSLMATSLPRTHGYIVSLQGGLLDLRVTHQEHEHYVRERSQGMTGGSSKVDSHAVQEDWDAENEVPLKLVPSHEEPSRTVHLCGPESDCRKGSATCCAVSDHPMDEITNHDGDDSQTSLYNDGIYTTKHFSITVGGSGHRRGHQT